MIQQIVLYIITATANSLDMKAIDEGPEVDLAVARGAQVATQSGQFKDADGSRSYFKAIFISKIEKSHGF